MFKKSSLAGIAVITMMSLCAPVMAVENTPENIPSGSVAGSESFNKDSSIRELDKTMYVTADMLYVRTIPSTEGEIIGEFCYGDDVKVTGKTEPDSEGQSWFRIVLNETEGFVFGEFLEDTAPAAAPAVYAETYSNVYASPEVYSAVNTVPAVQGSVQPVYTGTASDETPVIKTSYVYAQSGTLVEIYKHEDGNWTYGDGSGLTWVTDYEAMTEGGEAFTSYDPANVPDLAAYLQTVVE